MSIAVIADIVGSRRLTDRAAAQRDLDAVIAAVERDLPLAREPFAPTVGDEQQATYESLDDALASITLDAARLLGIDQRVGSIEKGKDGDLALFDGDPFEYTTHATATIINGVQVSDTVR